MGISSWIVKEAESVIKATEGRDEIIFETGYGPSGLPHIGTFAENARTCFLIEAVKQMAPNKKIRLLVFSDDMDGLRQVPKNVPNGAVMKPFLGAPLTVVPSPFGGDESFGAHNNRMLRDFLDSFGFKYEFLSATDCYSSGRFDEMMRNVMKNHDKIREIFIRTIAADKREAWSPFFVVCQNCGKINTTRIENIRPDSYEVEYVCDTDTENYHSCGHKGVTDIFGGKVKVGWKVDWAMRWAALGIDYEMHGEDLIESVRVSRQICQVLCGKAPITFKYELFQDEHGRKISKKIGNGLSMEQWLRYTPLAALVYFLLGNPNKPRRMGAPILPGLVDDFLAGIATDKEPDISDALWYLRKFSAAKLPTVTSNLNYTLLYNVLASAGGVDADVLFKMATRYSPEITQDQEYYKKLCEHVALFYDENKPPKAELNVNKEFLPHLPKLREYLASLPTDENFDGDEMQRFLFSITKDNGLNQREWFAFLYNVFLDAESGPKMGPYFAVLGLKEALKLVNLKITQFKA